MLRPAARPGAGDSAGAGPQTAPEGFDVTGAGRGQDSTLGHVVDYAPAPGWTLHANKDGRLFYCNHVTRTSGWLPPAEAWKCGENALPYGWERALDDSGKTYYINHLNKTTTYETPMVKNVEPLPKPEPRSVTLERSPALGFGFVAGSEKPVIVRFVTEGGPSVDKLLPGDQILRVQGEDVAAAPREHVIALVRACADTVDLVVCQPAERRGAVRKSTLLSAGKRARLRCKPSRVRFAESVCVNGAPLFPPSAFSLGEMCVPPMANVLKVFLENGQTKSFKYDAWTTVRDVVESLEQKLCLTATEHFSLVVEHIKSLKRNKLTLLDPQDVLARIASRPGAHKLRCLYRVAFVPPSAAALAQRDLPALDYLYTQCCNDVVQERFAPELQHDTALRLAALHIYQHALANNMSAGKLTVKAIEREFGLERFVPASLLDHVKRKEVRKLVGHFLKLHANMAGAGKQLTALQAKLHYLDIVAQLPSYGAKCFSAGPRGDATERVVLVSPRFGISQITGSRNSVFQPIPIATIESMRRIEVRTDDEISRTVLIRLQTDKTVSIPLEERDASELVLVLKGYYRLQTGQTLPVDQEEAPPMEDLAPPYLSQHKVVPEKWSYIDHTTLKLACFAMPPIYRGINNKKTNGLYNTMGRQTKQPLMIGYSLDSNMNSSMADRNRHFLSLDQKSVDSEQTGTLENGIIEATNEEMRRRVQEMHQLVEYSERYLTEQENLERLNSLAEWQETSVDIESDSDEPGKLKHSDSLLLLNKAGNGLERRPSFTSAAIELLRQDTTCSESDNDSIYTPNNSPKHKLLASNLDNKLNRVSFGLRSPDPTNRSDATYDFQAYLQHLRDVKKNGENAENPSANDLYTSATTFDDNTFDDALYTFDADLIDLTLLPPPATPDELDATPLPVSINVPPRSFADSIDKLNKLGILDENQDLEDFLASVTVHPPTQQITPAVELTPEEIMAYIIPPPPTQGSHENLTMREQEENKESPWRGTGRSGEDEEKFNVIEYATFDRKGAFSCCAKIKNEKTTKTDEDIQPLPRRSSDEKPPDRPPKSIAQQPERQRSHSLTTCLPPTSDFPPPTLPPRGVASHQAPAHLYLPPKKPPLPPLPSLEVLRQKKTKVSELMEGRTASIGSPLFQRSRKVSNDLEEGEGVNGESENKGGRHATAVSTPTSPHMGRGAHLRLVPVPMDFPDRPLNGCTANRDGLLQKTDCAMANLLARLDQVAGQCAAAQVHGGGRFISEEKFQSAKEELTTQSLQLVTSSKMLVIAMSDPSLPDLPENLAICLTILRRLTELCQDLANHTTAPLQTRNLVAKVRDVTAAFRHLLTSEMDRTSRRAIEEHLAAQAEGLANVLATLLRSLRVFSP
ncbi:unnamed protein product [Phaedon cochleariae]|uniref:FERM and PDZ domain-containing protein 4 n=1 Tax=Phaedon cochleariae TaxID=80249 RepID=A0A9P0DBB8_PHACE|nr:unnamed protein product [Phaedon cochleariae]